MKGGVGFNNSHRPQRRIEMLKSEGVVISLDVHREVASDSFLQALPEQVPQNRARRNYMANHHHDEQPHFEKGQQGEHCGYTDERIATEKLVPEQANNSDIRIRQVSVHLRCRKNKEQEKERSYPRQQKRIETGPARGERSKVHMEPSGDDHAASVHDGAHVLSNPAPPGLGAATLWAREASSLKRKIGLGDDPGDGNTSFFSVSGVSVTTVPMPSTNKELAVLIRDVIGARPKYGDESARPVYWPKDVPWKKGKSLSQMNNFTLRRLARAVVQHQARARERSRLTGENVIPMGGVGCGRRTKKELSALIRSKLGLRLQYGEKGRRPAFWPADVPWKKGKPLSMMNHGELSRVFSAMVGAGLCPIGACLNPPHIYKVEGSDCSTADEGALTHPGFDHSATDQSSSTSSLSPSIGRAMSTDHSDIMSDPTAVVQSGRLVRMGREMVDGVDGDCINREQVSDIQTGGLEEGGGSRQVWSPAQRESDVFITDEAFVHQVASSDCSGECGTSVYPSDFHQNSGNPPELEPVTRGIPVEGSMSSFPSLGSLSNMRMDQNATSSEEVRSPFVADDYAEDMTDGHVHKCDPYVSNKTHSQDIDGQDYDSHLETWEMGEYF